MGSGPWTIWLINEIKNYKYCEGIFHKGGGAPLVSWNDTFSQEYKSVSNDLKHYRIHKTKNVLCPSIAPPPNEHPSLSNSILSTLTLVTKSFNFLQKVLTFYKKSILFYKSVDFLLLFLMMKGAILAQFSKIVNF